MNPLALVAQQLLGLAAHGALAEAARGGPRVELTGTAGAAGALQVALAARTAGRPLLLVAPDIRRARRLATDLRALAGIAGGLAVEAFVLPPLEGDPYALVAAHEGVQRERVASLAGCSPPLAEGVLRALVVPARSLLIPVPPPSALVAVILEFAVGEELPPEEAARRLSAAGFTHVDVVASWGEFSRRGAVLDVFSPDDELPLRAEYWGDEIAEIRRFDPVTQRSVGAVARAEVAALREGMSLQVASDFAARVRASIRFGMAPAPVERLLADLDAHGTFPGFEVLRWAVEAGVSPLAHLPGAFIACDHPERVEAELDAAVQQFENEWTEEVRPFLPGPAEILRDRDAALEEAVSLAHVLLPDIAWDGERRPEARSRVPSGTRELPRHAGDLGWWLREALAHVGTGGSIAIAVGSAGRRDRLKGLLGEAGLGAALEEGEKDRPGGAAVLLGEARLSGGFTAGDVRLLAEADLFGDEPVAARATRRRSSAAAFSSDLRDLARGDFVVHVDHGVGRFEGLQSMGAGPEARDFMVLVFHDDDKLYVPLDRLDLVEKYTGVAGHAPRVDRLGGGTWEKVKATVKRSLLDMTRELLDLYAARRLAKGFRFSTDGEWQREFEASFPHEETEDQAKAIGDVKRDMEGEVPMDRLVVGDVGYGKTEVALRAAFKAVMDGKQVAVLAPTTVLAFQHHATFTRRMASWPVRVDLLSRFRSPSAIAATLAALASGDCDVTVGTHRLLSKDVTFKDLGLLVVDEEQRFGVRHKERIKALRKEVDVLTLTATPIPRTLSMALGGLRDMSVIETPPVGRQAIATHVLPFSPEVTAAACRQELDRGGQVFLVHDRVQSIHSMSSLVRKLVPGARIGVAHGQMPEKDLERVMVGFVNAEIDILVSTTVIENGLDVPRANTMIVNRADRHGLSQLYQLRGRVGRSERQAHAYLFVPAGRLLNPDARRRLAALQEFTELGSGFRIAALDLEIRGAGSLLGGQQHGHLASLGFDTYVRLLEDTVRELTGQEAISDFRCQLSVPLDLRLPESYVAAETGRLMVYKRFATARDAERIEALVQEVKDRHGPPPAALERLAEHARLRVRCEQARILALEADSRTVKVRFSPETKVHPTALMRVLREREGSAFSPDGVLSVRVGDQMAPVEAAWDLLRDLA